MKPARLAGTQKPPRAALAARRDTAAAGAGIPAFSASAERHGFKLPARAGASEDPAARRQAVERGLIQRGALALPNDLTVPLETVRSQRREHPIGDAFAAARRVDILDPQQPLAASRPRVAVARQRGDERAEVQRPGWRRCEAAAVTRHTGH